MLKFNVVLEQEYKENHIPDEDKTIYFSGNKLDTENMIGSRIPDEFYQIPHEKYEELKTKGEVTFTYIQTVTVTVKNTNFEEPKKKK